MSDETKTDADAAVLAKVELRDWRILDGEDSDLTEAQKQPWAMTVSEGGWGVLVDFTAPDGTVRRMAIELNQGNPRVFFGTDSDENDAAVTLCREGIHVRADRGQDGRSNQSVVIGDGGMVRVEAEPEADFRDEDAPAP